MKGTNVNQSISPQSLIQSVSRKEAQVQVIKELKLNRNA